MRRVLRSLLWVAFFATVLVASALALSPDDAIEMSQQGVDDETIIAKICSDGEAWDLTTDDIAYLRELGVSEAVIRALMDPEAAAERYGFTLGDEYDDEDGDDDGERTAYVYSLGYYYGPLSRFYYCDPFFYSYYFHDGFAFSYSYWPSYYARFYFPYAYGYYAYPYFYYPYDSYYYGYGYCGPRYTRYYYPPPGSRVYYGNVRYRQDLASGPPAYLSGKPNAPEHRTKFGSGYGDARGRLSVRDPIRWERSRDGSRRGTDVRARDPVVSRGRGAGSGRLERPERSWRVEREPRVIRPRSFERRTVRPDDPDRSVRRESQRRENPRGEEQRRWQRSSERSREPRSTLRAPERSGRVRGLERRYERSYQARGFEPRGQRSDQPRREQRSYQPRREHRQDVRVLRRESGREFRSPERTRELRAPRQGSRQAYPQEMRQPASRPQAREEPRGRGNGGGGREMSRGGHGGRR
jgi:hypothetical protein